MAHLCIFGIPVEKEKKDIPKTTATPQRSILSLHWIDSLTKHSLIQFVIIQFVRTL